jgi:hypothetical protein
MERMEQYENIGACMTPQEITEIMATIEFEAEYEAFLDELDLMSNELEGENGISNGR